MNLSLSLFFPVNSQISPTQNLSLSLSGGFVHHTSIVYLCTDINPHACRTSKRTGTQNKVRHSHLSLSSPPLFFYHSSKNEVDTNSKIQKKTDAFFFGNEK